MLSHSLRTALACLVFLAFVTMPSLAQNFPKTIVHKTGETSLERMPERIVPVASAAMSFQTPLALEYLFEVFPFALSAAVGGDPSTEIPELEL